MFNEELGVVMQISNKFLEEVKRLYSEIGIDTHEIAKTNSTYNLNIYANNNLIYNDSLENLHKIWHRTSYEIQKIRDNSKTSNDEYNRIGKFENKGLYIEKKFSDPDYNKIFSISKSKPKVAILREQGINGHYEMANAFSKNGFDAVDVTTNSLILGENSLDGFQGVVFCGGFSYGDVLGAGRGWANKILHNEILLNSFSKYFNDLDKFILGICNGCQTLANLKNIIPGSQNWPSFEQNDSERFESRIVMVNIEKSNSIFFEGMEGSRLPIVISHGEGKAVLSNKNYENLKKSNQICLSYIGENKEYTEDYPYNPNGSYKGIAGVSSISGNITLMMPHPERLLDICQFPTINNEKVSPWSKFFYNARMHLK